jgi:hypothetical protein
LLKDAEVFYYDRKNLRMLYFMDIPIFPAGTKPNPDEYGVPAPPVKYCRQTQLRLIEEFPSHWMYHSKEPAKHDVGRVAPLPSVDDLPMKRKVITHTPDEDVIPPMPGSQVPSDALHIVRDNMNEPCGAAMKRKRDGTRSPDDGDVNMEDAGAGMAHLPPESKKSRVQGVNDHDDHDIEHDLVVARQPTVSQLLSLMLAKFTLPDNFSTGI